MELNLAGRSVVVTGGGSNIGRAIVHAFARERAHVTIAEIDTAQGEKVAAEARQQGAASALVVRTDVTDRESVQQMVREVEARRGGIDVLVNNAGGTVDALFMEKQREEWEREVQLNFWGAIHCIRAVLDGMIARGSGAIVSLGSDAGRVGQYGEAVYGACKAGIVALSKSLATEVGKHGVRLNVVCPGMTMPDDDSEISPRSMWTAEGNRRWRTDELRARIAKNYPLRRLGTAAEVADAVVFLASDASSYITGQTLSVSGGYSMV
ncbi:MAG TPA: SDR family NAD(P)-dependent oxidoreductase [Myxococcota bacterium]|nr:SDR family NAD(P)-dependent oxidoreductase [Myxococcota bacterium]